ncbi:MAG: homocitrate synthase family protein [Methanomassiliicoccales archaeon]|nr:homocitrate synthase family protein [Methanomassiliicoccales archaeon]
MHETALSPYNPKLEVGDVVVYDSTLRDGEQTPGVTFSLEQKVAIARKLDEMRVPQIEAGFPAVSEAERESVKAVCDQKLDADILVLSRITKGDIDASIDAGVDIVLLFIGTSDLHIKYKFKKDQQYVLDKIVEGVEYAKSRGVKVSMSAEDTTRTELNFLMKVYHTAEEAGADRVGVTDTLGCASPEAISFLVSQAKKEVRTPVSLHLHNDFGLALANAIAGVKAGADAVTTTVNGIGERCGNVPLEQFVATMKFIYGKDLGIDCAQLKEVSEMVETFSGLRRPVNQPLVGQNAFSHESGIHVAAVLNCPLTYESIPPEAVGNKRHILMGKHTGLNYIRKRVDEIGLMATEQQLTDILEMVKELGEKKGRVDAHEFREIVAYIIRPVLTT